MGHSTMRRKEALTRATDGWAMKALHSVEEATHTTLGGSVYIKCPEMVSLERQKVH